MAEKLTIMKLKVDLQCEKCYKKVNKILSKFSQIRDQVYDEKQNTVIIKVVCCNPEKIRDKLCCKGCGSIKSIEIVDTTKPELLESETKKEPEEPPKKEQEKAKTELPEEKSPPPVTISIGICCVSCYEGRPGGPCFEGYGGPPPCYCGCYCGRPVYGSYGGGRPCYVSRCDQYFSDENPSACTIM